MTLLNRRLCLSVAFLTVASLVAWNSATAQPSLGGAKKKANENKEDQNKKNEPEKQDKPKDPVVFAIGPNEKAHFEIDSASKRNVIKFESKAPKETIEGKVTKIEGSLDFNPRKLDAIEGKFTIDWKDVDTGNKTRNEHMMSAPWIDAKSNPQIVFTVTGIENLSAKVKPIKSIKADLVGKMALNGKEKEMKIPVTLSYLETTGTPKKGEAPKEGLGIRAGKFKLALADFDIKGRGVGDKVAAELDFATASMMLVGPEHKEEKKAMTPKTPVKKPPPKGA
ncbi:MAG: YceI family protein [Planctomycetota bacterium]